MKIAFVTQPWEAVYPPLTGSVEIQTFEAARRLAKSCQVIVYARRSWSRPAVEWSDGVEFRRFPSLHDDRFISPFESLLFRDKKRPHFASSFYHIWFAIRVARDLMKQKCDLIHVQNFHQIASLIKKYNPKSKVLLEMHCDWLANLDPELVLPRLLNLSAIIGDSDFVTENIKRCFPGIAGRCRTVYYGIDVVNFQGAPRKDPDTQRILYVGRVSPEKGAHVLLEAFRLIAARCPAAELHVVGPDAIPPSRMLVELYNDPHTKALQAIDTRNYRQTICAALPEASLRRVHFHGAIPNNDLPPIYRNSSVFVFPSECHEGFGIPVIEAMASGLPVVATRSGGVTESVQHGRTGFLVDRGDSKALADAVIGLLENPELRRKMGDCGRERALDFSWEKSVSALLALYQSVYADDEVAFLPEPA